MLQLNPPLRCVLFLLTLLQGQVAHCQDARTETSGPQRIVHVDGGDAGMVVSDSAPASRIGREILRAGGSAVDAAVATAFALAVAWPDAGNIGGGGFMMVRPADGLHPVCIDYRETAPLVMHARSFTRDDTTFAHKAVGVPGTVRGLAAAHQRFGKLPWQDLVIPAARLAEDGVPVDRALADSLNDVLGEPRVIQESRFDELRRVYGHPDGRPWRPGDRLVLPDLGKTLRVIAREGADAFYQGSIANQIVDEMQRGDGLISKKDLERYQAKLRPAIRGEYRGYTILGAPPPSSGGICVIETLNILENFDLGKRDRYAPETIHLIAESMRRAFADRARYLGDPDFVSIPSFLTEKSYAKRLSDTIDLQQATPSAAITPELSLTAESPDTTHFSVVDGEGMAVSNTYTLEASWGSRIVVKDAGFVLNNEMGDFNWFPGETNTLGRVGTPANTVAGGKRMLSSQSPTIVEKDGKLVLVTGSPGGRTIINTVTCILLNLIDFQQSPAAAVANVRMHHQWFPDRIDLERNDQDRHTEAIAGLIQRGHNVADRLEQGSAHSIAIDDQTGRLIGIADYRRGGRPASLRSHRVALWDFAEAAETPMPRVACSLNSQLRWSTNSNQLNTDGLDHLQVRGDAGPIGWSTQVDLPSLSPHLSVEIKFDSARFQGEDETESLQFSLGSADNRSDRELATLTFGRRGGNGIWVSGRTGGGTIDPIRLSSSDDLSRPLVLRLHLDPTQQRFEIAARDADQDAFRRLGATSVTAGLEANYFRIGVQNDLSQEGEFVHIDRIELLSHGIQSR